MQPFALTSFSCCTFSGTQSSGLETLVSSRWMFGSSFTTLSKAFMQFAQSLSFWSGTKQRTPQYSNLKSKFSTESGSSYSRPHGSSMAILLSIQRSPKIVCSSQSGLNWPRTQSARPLWSWSSMGTCSLQESCSSFYSSSASISDTKIISRQILMWWRTRTRKTSTYPIVLNRMGFREPSPK